MVDSKAIQDFRDQIVEHFKPQKIFHAQQYVEKYFKARLQEADTSFTKTHDLSVLLDLLTPIEPIWKTLGPRLRILNSFAVEVRYPGQSADKEMAREAVVIYKDIRKSVRQSLGLRS